MHDLSELRRLEVWLRRAALALILLGGAAPALATDAAIPRPAELQPDVDFWISVYSQISTNEGFIHDQHRLSVVYETLHFSADQSPRAREQRVDAARDHYSAVLRHLASGAVPADAEEIRIRQLWGPEQSLERLRQAADEVRFQLGQSDRFRAGLIRASVWETHIAESLANLGLPAELAALPHVESSFDPTANSKVGAAGLWQFIRSTGRRFLRIDAAVDERLDPFRATEAAAQLLAYNFRVLGSWPLAITAYNHGAAGMRRARDQLGTDDIVRIVREYHSPSFGFASRNFYVSFLAALTIDQNPEKYFGPIEREREAQFHELEMPVAASTTAVQRALSLEPATLRALNPALLASVWAGRRQIPRGYHLRLPLVTRAVTAELLAQRLGPAPATPPGAPAGAAAGGAAAGQGLYVVARGDTLSGIAARNHLTVPQLLRFNGLRDQDHVYEGQRLQLSAETAGASAQLAAAVAETRADTAAQAAAAKSEEKSSPVSVAQAASEGPTLVPGAEGSMSPDPLDYSVAADGSIRVAPAETLGHYADWVGVSAARLRTLNGLGARDSVVIGRRFKLALRRITPAQFEQRRRDYHQQLQAEYFATHRISGTEIYIARRGDSLWVLTQRNAELPIWLLQQYNPDVDFNNLRPGAQIVVPQIVVVPGV